MIGQRKLLMALSLVGCLVAIAQAQAATSRSGVISKFDGVDEIVEQCTTRTSFGNVPQMSRTFSISGGASSVVVTFSGAASLFGQPFDTGFVRLTIDNVQQTPGEVPFVSVDQSSNSNSFSWQSASLANGSHTARVQWRTDLGSSFCLDARSLIVLHR
jgi:hypothetical protein